MIGGSFVFNIQQVAHRYHIKNQIKKGTFKAELFEIVVTEANVAQLDFEDEHEFEYEGVMYDIVKTDSVDPGTVVYHCLRDMDETELIADFEKLMKKRSILRKNLLTQD